jgi:preprotein translocase subunit SecB
MDNNKQPGISFEAILLKELFFSRSEEISLRPELEINLEAIPSFSPEEDKMNLEMICQIKDKNNLFNIKCTMLGIFSIMAGNENMSLKEFSHHNAPALVFPYVREAIASITVKAGIPPVILPPINISAVTKKPDDEIEAAP